MDKKLYMAPELELIEMEAKMAIMAGSAGSTFDDEEGEGGDAPMDNTSSDSSAF